MPLRAVKNPSIKTEVLAESRLSEMKPKAGLTTVKSPKNSSMTAN